MVEKTLTLHPHGKSGKSIDKEMYDSMKSAILRSLRGDPLTHGDMLATVKKDLKGFPGNIPWYLEAVKLDLEARRLVRRLNTDPPRYKRKQKSFVPRH